MIEQCERCINSRKRSYRLMVLRNYFRNAHALVNKIDCRYAALRATVAKVAVTACGDVGHFTVGHWATAGCV